ncbi:hypothetical protein F5051DRAFT_33762 [Lentinula edodes]|uniref:CCHC-type domain-containing protein n=1 Tax=Lentinula lateritia TaxID=40482 RepID=A0A9W9DDY6_9AGAR|nr:hypothetical protein F5051DRAFT_33762 [Lentinula edodes]KAJ4464652.1 hypothetical protein C8J55DRAFT_268856 [Lentinula edodes]
MSAGRGCFNCGGFGHQAKDCPKKTPTCYNCGGDGHVSRDCTQEAKAKTCYKSPDINQVANATAVAKLGTSRAHALKTHLGVAAVDTTIVEDFPRKLATLAVV